MRIVTFSALCWGVIAAGLVSIAAAAEPTAGWQAGAASAVITPKQDMWMSGYAARKKPSEGVAQDLYAKALALKGEDGAPLVLVTTDLIGIRRDVRDKVAERCQTQYQLPPERLILNASHTHCGPEYRPRDGREEEAKQYQAFLEQTLVQVVGQAIEKMAPASVSYSRGRCGFAMNRRRPTDKGYVNSPEYDGPVDHAVPVLCVHGADKKLLAVAFGYACHNTTLSSVTLPPEEPKYMFNGDYAGFAQQALQQAYPGAVAMFVNGCSGDQNPYPRNGEFPGKLPLEMAEHHGKTLAGSVVAAMLAGSRPLAGPIRAAFGEVELTRNNDKPKHVYPVQVIRLGDMLTLVTLGSETVVDYSLRLKGEIDSPAVWVAGYSNDYAGYIPSRRVAVEGGYEAQNDYTLDVEERIVGKVHELVRSTAAEKNVEKNVEAKTESAKP